MIVNFNNMKTLPYLPREIVDIILEYHGGIIHRDKFAPMLKGIIFHSIGFIYKNTPWLEINSIWGKDHCRRMMEVLLECKCCIDHQKNRPTLEDFDSGIVPHYNTHISSVKSCKCSCKHISRAICRDINDEILDEEFIHPYELEPSDEDWPWGIPTNPLQ